MDSFHHGIGYGEPPETARFPDTDGLDLAPEYHSPDPTWVSGALIELRPAQPERADLH